MIVEVSLSDVHKTIKEYKNLGYLHVGTVRTIDGVTLRFRDPIVLEENNITGGANKCRILVLKEFAIV